MDCIESAGRLTGEEYKKWLCDVIKSMLPVLADNGSIVIEVGNAWNAGEPTFSTLPMETLLEIKKEFDITIVMVTHQMFQ